jgi:O-antigen ligase
MVRSWWRRVLVTLAILGASALFIPWPSVFLQPVAPGANTAYATAISQIMGESRFDSWDVTTLSGRGSVSERYYAVSAGIRIGLDHPFLGVGLDQYAHYYVKGQYRPKAAKDMRVDHAHSLFPEVAAELGLFAVVLLGILVLAAIWSTWRVSRAARDRVTGVVAAAVMAGIAAWAIGATAFGCMIYRASLLQASDVVTFAVLVGMAVAVGRLHQRDTRVGA